ncbi:MAG TPA: ABC transporter permease, partial [Candidatus Limnocylindria bacterium]|nr:ABC transporter permease [Candidatus Limnocylindria bacterium]
MLAGRRLTPYLLLLPGAIWLLVFFVAPMAQMAVMSLQEGSLSEGYTLTWNWGIYPEVATQYANLFVRSVSFALLATLLTLAIGYPMAYFIAFYGGRMKTPLLLIVIMPFFVSFVIRTLNWRMILSDNGLVFGTLKELGWLDPAFRFLATPASVIFGLTYNFLPFMVLPLYVALEKIDRRLIEAATDLYASRAQAFWRVTFVLSLPGVVAGSLLT